MVVSTGPRMYCVASKLLSTEGGGCRINRKSDQYNSGDEVQKVAKKRTSSENLFGIGDNFQVKKARNVFNVHCWKEKQLL